MFARVSAGVNGDVRSCGVDGIAAALTSNAGIWIEWKFRPVPLALGVAGPRVGEATHPAGLTKQRRFREAKLDGNAASILLQ